MFFALFRYLSIEIEENVGTMSEVKLKKSSASETNGSSNGDSAVNTLKKSIKKAAKKPAVDEYEMDTSDEEVS